MGSATGSGWLAVLHSSANTRVLLNGVPGPPIWHRRGLRQGDPLSPQLFVLAVDTLGRLFRRAIELNVLQQLHPRRNIPVISLYADDVILFCHSSPEDTLAVKEILQLFGRASGLRVNFQKSTATLIRCDADAAAPAIANLGCPLVDLLITYLGIPLTIRRPTTAQLQFVVDKTAGKLPTWKAHLMDRAGRLAFVKAVLSAIPIHQLLVLAPPKKILKLLEKIQRGFLWAARADANGGHCHVNWRRVCRPIQLGGLGVRDLQRTGLALRIRWLWFNKMDDGRAWSGLDLQFTQEEQAFFFASTFTILGNGQRARFWEDRWLDGRAISEIVPTLYAVIPKRRRKSRTVADGLLDHRWATDIQGTLGIHEIGQYLMLWHAIDRIVLTAEPDRLHWRLTATGTYTAKSAYLATFHGSASCPAWKLTWKAWAPPRVKFFHWLANLGRCWKADRLARRGLPHPPCCPLCDQAPESIQHLFFECSFSKQVWLEILLWLHLTCHVPDGEENLTEWWNKARQSTAKLMHKRLASAALLIPWMTWKHRNDCVFNAATPSTNALVSKIKDEAALWARAGALGLRALLPNTWDVH